MGYKPPCQGLIDSREPRLSAPQTRGGNGPVSAYRCPVCGVTRRHFGPLDRNDFAPIKRCYSRFFGT